MIKAKSRDELKNEINGIEYKTTTKYGRKLYWNKTESCYSSRVSSSHLQSLKYFPEKETIEISFLNGSTYVYEGYDSLFDIFARIVSGNGGTIGQVFWKMLRKPISLSGIAVNYYKK
ncbi:MAG: hypothetical protein ACRCZ9_02375 [Fusobacteriaceae bacterium]